MSETLNDEQSLRKSLHDRIDRLNREALAAVDQIVRRLQIDKTVSELDAAFDEDRRQGKLTPPRIRDAIARHRAAHPDVR